MFTVYSVFHAFVLKGMEPDPRMQVYTSIYLSSVNVIFWVIFVFFATNTKCANNFLWLVLENVSAHTCLYSPLLPRSIPILHCPGFSAVRLGRVTTLLLQCKQKWCTSFPDLSPAISPCLSLFLSQKDLNCGIGLSVNHGKGSDMRD